MGRLEYVPKTITCVEPRRSISCRSLGSGSARRSSSSRESQPQQQYEPPSSSRGKPLQPIFPWEESSSKERIPTPHNHNRKKQASQHYVLVILLFVTVALTTGKLLPGGVDAAESSHNDGSGKKQRGQHLPSANSTTQGDSTIAEDMYRVYQALKDDYQRATTLQNDRWKLLNEREGITVSILRHDADPTCPYVRMETTLPASVAACWEFLGIHNWHWSMPKMDPFYDSHEVYSNYTHNGVNMVLVQKKTHRILAFGRRDFAFLSVSDLPRADGTMVSVTVGVETPDVPRSAGYTRAFQDSIAFYKPVVVEGEEEHCRVTIVCRIDLNDSAQEGSGGFMPMWLYVKTIGATGIKSMQRMKNALLEMKGEQDKVVVQEVEEEASAAANTVLPAPMAAPVASPTMQHVPTPEPTMLSKDAISAETTTTNPKVVESTKEEIHWSTRPRGGASFVVHPAQAVDTTRRQDTASAIAQKWKPLYGVFTHIAAAPRPTTNGGGRPPKWLQRVPFIGATARIS